MILDSIDRLDAYASLHPRFKKAMECIAAADYHELQPGEIN